MTTVTTSERPPLVAALTFFAAIGFWATLLLMGQTDVDGGVATMAGSGGWMAGTVALVGLVVSRGRWAQRLAIGMVLVSCLAAAYTPGPATFVVGLVLSALAGALLLAGPMTRWIRPGRSMEAPPDAAVVLMIGLVLWPLAGSWLATGPLGWTLWAGPLLAFWYGRATIRGLWATRVGAALVPLVAALGSVGWVAPVAGLVIAAATSRWAWHPDARLAVVPLTGRPQGAVCPTPDFDRILREAREDA